MPSRASAIIAAELLVAQSRLDLHHGLGRLRRRLSQPSSLAAAAAVGALLGFTLSRGRAGAVARLLAIALIRYGVRHLASGKRT